MNNTDIELRVIFAVLRRQMRVIFLSFVVVFTLAGLFLAAANPKYTATGLIMVDPAHRNLLDTSQGFASERGNDSARIDSEVEILRSSTIAMDVILSQNLIADTEFGPKSPLSEKLSLAVGMANASAVSGDQLASKTLARFKDAISIRRKGLTYLIAVSVSTESPAKSATIANVLARSYIDRQVQSKVAATVAARDVLQAQIKDARLLLADSDAAFDTFVAQNADRLKSVPGNDNLRTMQMALAQSTDAIENRIDLKTALETQRADQDWQGFAATLGDQTIAALDEQRQKLIVALTDTNDAAKHQDLTQTLAKLDRDLSQQAQARLLNFDLEVQKLEQTRAETRDSLRQAVLNSDLPADLLAEIYAIQQEANISRSQYRNLLMRLHDLDAQSRVQMADSELISPALAPISASFPNKNLVLLAAFAAAMSIGVSMAFVNEYYLGGVSSSAQLSEILQVDAVTLPAVQAADSIETGIADQIIDEPLSPFSESLRNLRATIDQSFRATKGTVSAGNTILVTSALPGEGKTITALALARTYALAGKKTLLIDADLRNPSVHLQLGFQPKIGFLDYLSSPADIEISDAFYGRDPATPLALIMGAERSAVPTDPLLDSVAFETLLSQARDVYDVIVIDTPSLLPVVDARYVAHNADAVVLVAKWAATRPSDLRAAVAPLRTAMNHGATLLPVLVQNPNPA